MGSSGINAPHVDEFTNALALHLHHQLTELALPLFKKTPDELLERLFMAAIYPLSAKLNPLRYLELLGLVVLGAIKDARLEFLENHAPKGVLQTPGEEEQETKTERRGFGKMKHSDEAAKADLLDAHAMYLALKAEVAIKECKIEAAKDTMDLLQDAIIHKRAAVSVPPMVSSWYYKASLLLYNATQDSSKYYEAGVNYLLYTPYESVLLDAEELAINMGIAALVTPEEYHFGELLELSVFTRADTKPWIYDLCVAFREGKFELFDAAMSKHKEKIMETPALKNNLELLHEKFKSSVLLEYAFSEKHRKRIDLQKLAAKTRVDDIESLLINAMAAGLVKGSIDQVSNIFCCTWVKPRVLDSTRLQLLQDRVTKWIDRQSTVLRQVEKLTPELLVS